MKKLVLAALASTAFVASPAFASTDTTVIYATIPLVCTIDGPPDNGSINLAGSTAIGNVTTQCNSPSFTASVTSAYGSALVELGNPGNPTSYPYTLTVAGLGTSALPVGPVTIGPPGSAALLTPQSAMVTVNTTGPVGGPAYAGTYQDTITWTINAN